MEAKKCLFDKVNSKISINGFIIGGNKKIIISGPCTFGSYEELYDITYRLKSMGITFIRGGAFKFRTDPNSFQGLRDGGMEILLKVKQKLNINIVVELLSIEQVRKYGNLVDIIQIGSRNMYNTELLKEVGKLKTPIILKRAFSATYNEWLSAATYILEGGNNNIILCERGIRNNISNETRNVLDIQAIPYLKKHTKFPIIVDPSHASGLSYMVVPMSKASLVAGADGLLIESHIDPTKSLCDNEQTIDLTELEQIINFSKTNY